MWDNIIALLVGIGGIEGIKELIRFFVNRKSEKRKAEASADDLELKNFTSLIETVRKENQEIVNQVKCENARLQDRLKDRDAKVDGLYIELRKEQGERMEWTRKYYQKELELKDAEKSRCDRPDSDCISGRIPPHKTFINHLKSEDHDIETRYATHDM